MRSSIIFFVAFLALAVAQLPQASIVIDGEFNDWARVPVALEDSTDPNSLADFAEVRIVATSRFLYVQLSTVQAVNVQALRGTISLLFDSDADVATGERIHGLPGVDLAVDLNPTLTTWLPGLSNGVGVRRFAEGSSRSSGVPSTINFAFAPRFEAKRFEFRLDRTASTKGVLKFVFAEGDTIRDETAPVPFSLPSQTALPTPEPTDRIPARDPLERPAASALRVAVWNVSGLQPAVRDRVAAIIEALDTDVLMLDETARQMTAGEVEQFLPTGQGTRAPWRVLLGESSERSLVAVRGSVERAFPRVPYPPELLGAALSLASPVDVANDHASYDEAGVGVTGALAVFNARRVLAVPVDLSSGGTPESSPEALRSLETQAIRAAVKKARMTSRPHGILIGGDFNLVGTRDPLDIVRRGLDLDGSELAVVNALQLDGLSANTWQGRGNGGRFPPGRLDWLLYGDSTLEVLGAFVFDSADLSPYWLAQHRLRANDSSATSVHQPIVADFRWRR